MATYYVATNGSSGNSGTLASPWDMQTAMNGSGIVGGDTVYVRGGTYSGQFVCYVKGSSDTSRVAFKPYGAEKVYFDANASLGNSIALQGAQYVDFWNFLFYNSKCSHSYNGAVTHTGRAVYRNSSTVNTGVRIINCVIHDFEGGAVSPFQETHDFTAYGCVMFYNGVNSHDHTAYTKNINPSFKRYEQCIMHNSAGHNVHGYSSADDIHNIQVVDCTIYQGGAIGMRYSDGTMPGQHQRNVLFGPDSGYPARDCLLQGSDLYYKENGTDYGATDGDAVRLGYGYGAVNTVVKDNYIMRGQFVQSGTLTGCTITGNTIWAYPSGISTSSWPNNTWLTYDLAHKPASNHIVVRKNAFDANRGNVSIYNWSGGSTASISNADLTAAGFSLASGDTYELWNVQAWGNDIISGTYNGSSISVDMTTASRKLTMPIGYSVAPVTTFPEFGAFVLFVTSSGGGGGTGPITVTPTPAFCLAASSIPGPTVNPVTVPMSVAGTVGPAAILIGLAGGLTPGSFSGGPASNGDDGRWENDGATWNNTASLLDLGKVGSGLYMASYVRFPAVTIPVGATITSATLTFVSGNSRTSTQNQVIRAEAADNPIAPTSYADINGRVGTTANVAWSFTNPVTGTSYTSPDITTVIQEVVNRAGWASGNAIMLLIKDEAQTSTNDWWPASEVNTTYAIPALAVNYTTGSGSAGMIVIPPAASTVVDTFTAAPPLTVTPVAPASCIAANGLNPTVSVGLYQYATSTNNNFNSGANTFADNELYAYLALPYNTDRNFRDLAFGLSGVIPQGSLITSVVIEGEWHFDNAVSAVTTRLQAEYASADVGTSLIDSSMPTTDVIFSQDITGALTLAQLGDASFGIDLHALRTDPNNAVTIYLDFLRVYITYVPPSAPAPASLVTGTAGPTVVLSLPPVTPTAPASLVTGNNGPTLVVAGAVTVIPTAASLVTATTGVAQFYGSVTIIPAAASLVTGEALPTVLYSGVSVHPAAAYTLPETALSKTILGSYTATAQAVTVRVESLGAQARLDSLTLTGLAELRIDTQGTTVVLGSIGVGGTASAVAADTLTAVHYGSTTATGVAILVTTTNGPQVVQASITVTPAPEYAVTATALQAAILGGLVFNGLPARTVRASAVGGLTLLGALSLTGFISLRIDAIGAMISYGSYTNPIPTPVGARLETAGPTVITQSGVHVQPGASSMVTGAVLSETILGPVTAQPLPASSRLSTALLLAWVGVRYGTVTSKVSEPNTVTLDSVEVNTIGMVVDSPYSITVIVE